MTIYTTVDMLRYNRKRKVEFYEAQRQMRSDSLEAARLAYMRGDATDEQITLVDEANAQGGGGGDGAGILKIPSILGTPAPAEKEAEGKLQTGATWPAAAAATTSEDAKTPEQKSGGIRSWLFSGLKKQEEGENVGTSERRLGWESLSEEDDGFGVRDSDLVRAIEEKQTYIKDKARQAFEKEKENQRTGGPLDRVGVTASERPEAGKKGWWPW